MKFEFAEASLRLETSTSAFCDFIDQFQNVNGGARNSTVGIAKANVGLENRDAGAANLYAESKNQIVGVSRPER